MHLHPRKKMAPSLPLSLRVSGADVLTALTVLHQIWYGGSQSTSLLISDAYTPSTMTSTTLPHPSVVSSVTASQTPSASPSSTITPTEDPLQRHLALIIGVPTGVGLSILGLSLCLLWLACSSYCEYRKSLPHLQPKTPSAGGPSRSANTPVNLSNSYTKSTSIPLQQTSTSATESQAFQPEPDPNPEQESNLGL